MRERRGWLARLGLTLLAFCYPGSAHVRLGRFKLAAALFCASLVLTIATRTYSWIVRDWTYDIWREILIAVAMMILLSIVSAVLAWNDSAVEVRPLPQHSRWYYVAIIPIASIALSFMPPGVRDSLQPFSIPAESMRPALEVGDYIGVQRRHFGPFRVGQILVFDGPDSARVDRVIALGGQRVELRRGVVHIDGMAARLEPTRNPLVVRETLPGEVGSHFIRREGVGFADDYGPVLVPRDRLFLLGDNRNMSADSRFEAQDMGIGLVPTTAVIGRAKFIWWSRTSNRVGRVL